MAISVAWAFTALPSWAAVLLALGTLAIYAVIHLITLIPFAAVTVVGLSTRCPERMENSKEYFHLYLRLLGR